MADTSRLKPADIGRIAALGCQIDPLVYELYGLTDEEIALVEGAGGRGEAERTAQSEPEE